MSVPQVGGYGYELPYQYYQNQLWQNPYMTNYGLYGMNMPTFCANPTADTYQPKVSQVSANQEIKQNDNTKKSGMSKGAKWALGIAGATTLAIGADFLFCKGSHVKNIIKKLKPDASDIKTGNINSSKPATEVAQPQTHIETAKTAEHLKNKTSEKIKKYSSLEEAKADFRATTSKTDFEAGKDSEQLLNQLEKHCYQDDKSFIELCSRSKEMDYQRSLIDIENHTLYKGYRMTPSQGFDQAIKPEFLSPDIEGSYLIKTLSDGRRVVGVSVTAGRSDGSGRPIRSILTTISKNDEFTPLQKDLIEIISARNTKKVIDDNATDILSLGIIGNNSPRGRFEINEEILLSSISTAKKQLKNIDNDFVTKALKGETLEYKALG